MWLRPFEWDDVVECLVLRILPLRRAHLPRVSALGQRELRASQTRKSPVLRTLLSGILGNGAKASRKPVSGQLQIGFEHRLEISALIDSQPDGHPAGRTRPLDDRPQPFHSRVFGRHRSQSSVAPQIAGDILQLERVDGVPLLLQPMRAGGNPESCGHVFHASILLYIYTGVLRSV